MNFLMELIDFNTDVPYKIIFILMGAGFAFLWLSLVVWVWIDSRNIYKSILLRIFFSFFTLIFSFVGLIVYLIFKFSQLDHSEGCNVGNIDLKVCPECGSVNSINNIFCTFCGFEIKQKCNHCKSSVFVGDTYCSKCGKLLLHNNTSKAFKKKKVESFTQLRYINKVFSKVHSFWRNLLKKNLVNSKKEGKKKRKE